MTNSIFKNFKNNLYKQQNCRLNLIQEPPEYILFTYDLMLMSEMRFKQINAMCEWHNDVGTQISTSPVGYFTCYLGMGSTCEL